DYYCYSIDSSGNQSVF
nr:immunoglobulin light chain junction region [Macaca mulatta]MOW28257.1 immunoglobulin light chain junction region [Macaca mulatta]MOW28600.1 immunoglobulin light chain junction region [Macaca mulatta]MOW28807.1 immunoglobulin light chain junction region [Macaca mulatta]MOW29028.1 immunoglobulin light chain junction region [Macaca mulatta]